MHILANQADVGTGLGLGAVGVGQQPLVAGPQQGIIAAVVCHVGLGGVRALGQGHQHAEALLGVGVAGSVVQRGGVDLYQRARGHAERLDLGGVQLAVLNLVLLGQQQDEVLGA